MSVRTIRWRALAVMTVAVAALVPVAISFACNPQASLRLNQPSFAPGGQMQVSGAFFKGNANLTLSIEPGGSSGSVTTAGNGFFATGMTAPTAPGSYTLSAIGFEPDGTVTPGLPARVSFQVTAPKPAQPAQPGSPARPSPTPGATRPGATPGAGQFAEPGVPTARPFGSPGRTKRGAKTPANRGGGGGASDRAAAVNTGAGVINGSGSGGGVFAGSVARADRQAAVASPGKKSAASKADANAGTEAAPSVRSALDDVWSGFGSDNAPSLMPRATDGAPATGGAGQGLAWGLGLMALGLLALAAGLAAAEVRRRRAHAD